MSHSRQQELLPDDQIACKQSLMAFVAVNAAMLLQKALQPGLQLLVSLHVVRVACKDDLSISVQSDAIVGIGQIFRCHPEIKRVTRHQIQRPAGRKGGGTRSERVHVQLADE